MMNYMTMMSLSNCLATGSTLHLGFLLPGLGSMVVCDATMRMQMLMPIPLLSCAVLDIHRAHRSSVRNSLVNNLSGDSQTRKEKKYLWVVIRTQKERKLQTLIEVCTDFASLGQTATIHRPAEQLSALEEDDDPEDMVAMKDHSQWTGPGVAEPNMPPSLQQMFTLARRMGYEMHPIARRTGTTRQAPGSPRTTGQGYRTPFRSGRDYSKVKCFSCGHMGHTQARCPKPDSSLPFRPDCWNTQSDGPQQRCDGPPQGNDI